MLKIGIDVHGVLDSAPHFFARLSRLLVENGHEVHILTGAEHTEELENHLRNDLGLSWTHFFSITTHHKEAGTEITYIDGNPYMDNQIWNRSKAEYCIQNGIHLHIDDSDIYGKYFTTPYARFEANSFAESHKTIKTPEPGINRPPAFPADHSHVSGMACDDDRYLRPSVSVDIATCAIIDDVLKVLLIRRNHPPFTGQLAIPGRFIDIARRESLEETAVRVLAEETGLKSPFIEQLKTYGDVNRDPRTRVITTAYYSLISASYVDGIMIHSRTKEAEFQWVSLMHFESDLASSGDALAFDHALILKDLRERLQGKISYTPIAFELLPEIFTWSELRTVYEAVLDKAIDPANFKKKIKSMYTIHELKRRKSISGAGRPPVYIRCDGIKDLYM